jgi:hypothetical protein
MSISFDFFERLVPRATGTFLIGALGAFGDFTAGSTSCTGDLSAVIFLAEGAMAASLFGSSLSLQRKPKERDFTQLERRKTSKKEHRVGKILTTPRGQKVLLPLLDRGFSGHSSLSRGTQRSKLLDALPLLVHAKIFRKRRRRRHRRAGIFL